MERLLDIRVEETALDGRRCHVQTSRFRGSTHATLAIDQLNGGTLVEQPSAIGIDSRNDATMGPTSAHGPSPLSLPIPPRIMLFPRAYRVTKAYAVADIQHVRFSSATATSAAALDGVGPLLTVRTPVHASDIHSTRTKPRPLPSQEPSCSPMLREVYTSATVPPRIVRQALENTLGRLPSVGTRGEAVSTVRAREEQHCRQNLHTLTHIVQRMGNLAFPQNMTSPIHQNMRLSWLKLSFRLPRTWASSTWRHLTRPRHCGDDSPHAMSSPPSSHRFGVRVCLFPVDQDALAVQVRWLQRPG